MAVARKRALPRLLTVEDLAEIFGTTKKSQIKHLRSQPGFPKPVSFGIGPRWRWTEIRDFIGQAWSLKDVALPHLKLKTVEKPAKKTKKKADQIGPMMAQTGPIPAQTEDAPE
jgi:predicted DNA-binding transcriptional regulator AlpA